MKRYIRAAFDASMPSWLKSFWRGNRAADLAKRYKVGLDRAKILDYDPGTEKVLTIYNIKPDYGTTVYIPGINDDQEERINGRYRKLGNISKSKLPMMSQDIAYIDLTDPSNLVETRERYQDPRYIYDGYSKKGEYGGQYAYKKYIGDGKYEDEPTWTSTGKRGRRERSSRDKSGYVIPSPESQIARYYSMFPDRITAKTDAVYQELTELRDKLFSFDFSGPAKRDWGSNDYRNALSYFSSAVDSYQRILKKLSNMDITDMDEFSLYGIKDLTRDLTDIRSDIQQSNTYFEEAIADE